MKPFLDFLQALQIAIKNAQLYGAEHPRVLEAMETLNAAAPAIFLGDRLLTVVSRGKLFVDGKPLVTAAVFAAAYVRLLTERKINGFTFVRELAANDLHQLVRILSLKSQKLDELGGAAQVLSQAGVTNIRVSHVRYEELVEGEVLMPARAAMISAMQEFGGGGRGGGADFGTGSRGSGPAAGGGGLEGAEPTGDQVKVVMTHTMVDRFLSMALGSTTVESGTSDPAIARRYAALASAGLTPADLSASAIGEVTPEGQETFREQAKKLSPEQQSSLVMGVPGTADGSVKQMVDSIAPELFAEAVTGFASRGVESPSDFAEFTANLFSFLTNRSRGLELLRSKLEDMGITREHMNELLELLAWESLTLDARMTRVFEGSVMFDLPSEKLLAFLQELLAAGRQDDFNRVLERMGAALFADNAIVREKAAYAFARVSTWGASPGLAVSTGNLLEKILLTHFVRESDHTIHARTCDALDSLIGYWIASGRVDRAYADLRKLEAATSAVQEAFAWKKVSFQSMLMRLCDGERMLALINQLYAHDAETVAAQYHPLLIFFGDKAASALLDALAVEEDRSHRGRLIKAIKAIGKPALQHLKKALESSTWFLVRNALNLLGDLAAVDLLDDIARQLNHSDVRVKRAAARALGKLPSIRAEKYLADALDRVDPETQNDILISLSGLKAEVAVPAIVELARKRMGGDDRLRLRAVEALGQIGSPQAVAPLSDILRKRGLLSGQVTPELRLTAARALLSIGNAEARTIVGKVAETEPPGQTRDQFARLLREGAPPPATPGD